MSTHDPRQTRHVEVAIVGGGPVGLYLGARLARDGIEVVVLEAREEPVAHSRAIGVHPPGLETLAGIGAAEPLSRRGVHVARGRAFGGDAHTGLRSLGVLDFERHLDGRYRYVLTVPQPVTERILATRLEALAPGALRRGTRVAAVRSGATGAILEWRSSRAHGTPAAGPGRSGPTPAAGRLGATLCIACDGSGGTIGPGAGFHVEGGRYGDTYLMADGPDRTPFGSDAVVFLPRAGVVESFPLPGALRRWVARTDGLEHGAPPDRLIHLIRERIGPERAPGELGPTSAFGVGWRLADSFARGPIWLAGDAAHVVSPIGGQGMNLGWLGAARAAEAALGHLRHGVPLGEAGATYDAAQRPRAKAAIARAALNMRAGRPLRVPIARDLVVRAALSPPFEAWSARLFTMRA